MPPLDSDTSRWFHTEVHPHEPALRAFLLRRVPTISDIDDLVQESYLRLIRARAAGKVNNARSYLFTIARNAAFDLFRRSRGISMQSIVNEEPLAVLEDKPGVAESVNNSEELEILYQAISMLPDRCREIMTLQKIHGLSNRAIAERLGLSVYTVNAHVATGLLRCREFLIARGILPNSMA